jgi:ketosteroid isomerase-like protein
MQDGNVQAVRCLLTAFNERDIDAVLELMDEDVEFYAPQTALSVDRNSTYQGHEGIRQYFEDVGAVWVDLQLVPMDFRSADPHVVALGTIVGERDGGVLRSEIAWAWKLRNGKIVWGRVYAEPAEALQDAGIG